MRMPILICCATPGELKTAKTQIKSLKLKSKLDIHYLCTGIGNYATIFSLSQFLTEQARRNPDQIQNFFLVNIGVCGYMSKHPAPKCIQIWRIQNLHTNKELLPPLPIVLAPITSIFCSEIVLSSRNLTVEEGFVDMESWGIERVADQFRIPRIFIKVPVDKVGDETLAFDKEKACQMLADHIDYELLIKKIQGFLNKK